MKANNGTGNNEDRDDWETPQWLFNKLDEQYDFDLDMCATKNNTKCKEWSNDIKLIPKLTLEVAWMNPPFSKAEEMFKHFFKVINEGVSIYRCDNMETKIWQNIILKNADLIFIPKGRINYEGKDGIGSRFPSALIGVGLNMPKDIEGVTLLVRNIKVGCGKNIPTGLPGIEWSCTRPCGSDQKQLCEECKK